VVRRGRVRAAGDDREGGLVVALGDQPLAHLARHLGSVRPTSRPAAIGRRPDRRRAPPGAAADLLGVLDRAQRREHRGGQAEGGVGHGRLEAEQEGRPQVIRHEQPAQPAPGAAQRAELDLGPAVARLEQFGDELERVSVSSQLTRLDEPAATPGCLGGGHLEARHDQRRAALGGTTSIVSRSSGMARVADQPLQVRADADQQRGGVVAGSSAAHAGEAIGVALGRIARGSQATSSTCARTRAARRGRACCTSRRAARRQPARVCAARDPRAGRRRARAPGGRGAATASTPS
jgi:hypothetical protein